MSLSLRRNTYVLGSTPTPTIKTIKTEMGISRIEKQNLMRLRVNRIALVQEIKVENIIPSLIDNGVLTLADKQNIGSGSTKTDKARILIDILPEKNKESDWYKHFREALLNPYGGIEVKKRYRLLVEFLDNTFIPRPTGTPVKISNIDSQVDTLKFPKYDTLPEIAEAEKDVKAKGSESEISPKDMTSNQNTTENQHISPNIETSEIRNILIIEEKVQTNMKNVSEENGETEKGTLDDNPEHEDKLSSSTNSRESVILVKGFVHHWVSKPENFTSILEIPEKLLDILEKSNTREDKDQINHENMVLGKMKKLELMTVLKQDMQLQSGFEICMCESLIEILSEPQYYHSYVKYFILMKTLSTDIVFSYSSVLKTIEYCQSNEITDQAIKHGFLLCDFFLEISLFADAEEVITLLLNFLNTDKTIDTWMNKYQAVVKLTHVRNKDYNFLGAEQSYFWAVQMTWPIQLMSFGKDLIQEGDLLIEMSHYQLELGSLSAGYGWAKRSLQELSADNHAGIVNALCNAVMAYCCKLQVKKAREIAVEAVLQAKLFFGTNHPMYLKALLHLCHFTCEFIHEEITLQIAEKTLALAWKMYGCECLQVALAHRSVSKALMMLHKFDTDDYYDHAIEGIRISRRIFPNQHPILHLFLHTFASALQWKALYSPKEVQDSTLHWAETEAKQALNITKSCYGELSLRTAQMYSLLGQIYSKMNIHPDINYDLSEEAEVHLKKCASNLKLCQTPKNHFYLLSLAALGIFYKLLNRPKEAIILLKEVVANIDSHGFYLWWLHVSYQHLMACYSELKDDISVNIIQQELEKWLEENPEERGLITLADLEESAKPYQEFIETFDIWGAKMKKVKHQLMETKTQLD